MNVDPKSLRGGKIETLDLGNHTCATCLSGRL
jgi:hypothetical protein